MELLLHSNGDDSANSQPPLLPNKEVHEYLMSPDAILNASTTTWKSALVEVCNGTVGIQCGRQRNTDRGNDMNKLWLQNTVSIQFEKVLSRPIWGILLLRYRAPLTRQKIPRDNNWLIH